MKAENWTFTEPAPVDRNWPGMPVSARTTAIEGNAVPMPDGEVAVILRIDPLQMPYRSMEQYNKALLVRQDKNDPEAKLQFDRVIDIPVGLRNKFTIYREPNGLGYAAMCNEYTEDYQGRGILTLAVSKDAINWKIAKRIVDVRDDFTHGMQNVGYSYPDFTFDGDDISVISRTAANGAKSQHDNNIISFFRIENYKQYFDIL